MRKFIALALVSVVAFGRVLSASGQGTLVFNNLDPRAGLVKICPGLKGPTPVLLNQDLNFMLLAGPVGEAPQWIHAWLLSDGSAKGIHVAPGRFKDPSDGIYTVPGVAPGSAVEICVVAWPGHYDTPSYGARASRAYGVMLTGPAGAPPPSLFIEDFTVIGVPVPYSQSVLGLARSHGLPQLSLTGLVGYGYALEYAPTFPTDPNNVWRSLMNQTNWVLTNSTQLLTDTSAAGAAQRFYRVGPYPIPPPPSLVWISPGTFLMGSPTNEPGRAPDEGPQTQVTLTYGFGIGQYEVKQIEYQTIMAQNPSEFIGGPDLPVESVSWEDGTNYCARLTDHERLAGRLPAGYVYRLPTEAEWEYAARAGTTTPLSYGDDPGYVNLTNCAWCAANSGPRPHSAGQKQPNAWGLYDMFGNVAEWCMDWYGGYPGGSVTDPKGPSSGPCRVIRGGDRPASRSCLPAQNWASSWGLRVVLAPPLSP